MRGARKPAVMNRPTLRAVGQLRDRAGATSTRKRTSTSTGETPEYEYDHLADGGATFSIQSAANQFEAGAASLRDGRTKKPV